MPTPCVAGETTIPELLQQHQTKIDELRSKVSGSMPKENPMRDGVLVDDIFLLRYILSYKTVEKAQEPFQKCLTWRTQNQGMLAKLENGEDHPLAEEVRKYQISGSAGSLGAGEPVFIVRLGMCDLRQLMNTYDIDTVAEFLLFEKERVWRACDKKTRESNLLIKTITIIDFANFSMFGSRSDNRFFKALGKSSKWSSLYYPQLQAKTVSINTPSYYNMIHKTISAVMPKSSMEKMVVCPAKKTHMQVGTSCPFLLKYNGMAAVPAFLGGKAECPQDLLPPNERGNRPETLKSDGGSDVLKIITIKPRSSESVVLQIDDPDTIVRFKVAVADHSIRLSATLEPSDRSSLSRRNSRRWTMSPAMKPQAVRDTDGLLKGSWKVANPGNLIVTFDNSFSLIKSKQISYSLSIVPPPEDEEEASWWDSHWSEYITYVTSGWEVDQQEQTCAVM